MRGWTGRRGFDERLERFERLLLLQWLERPERLQLLENSERLDR